MAYRFTTDAYYTSALPTGIASNETTLTMACWFKAADITNAQRLISVADTSRNNHWHMLAADGATAGDPVGMFSNAGGGAAYNYAVTTSGYSANTWYHACGVVNGASSRAAYINGGSKGTDTGTSSPTSMDAVGIGALWDLNPNHSADVIIAEAAIWDVALTDGEIAELAAGKDPRRVRPQNLVFHPRLVREIIDDVGGLALSTYGTPVVSEHPGVFMPRPSIYVPTPSAAANKVGPLINGGLINTGLNAGRLVA